MPSKSSTDLVKAFTSHFVSEFQEWTHVTLKRQYQTTARILAGSAMQPLKSDAVFHFSLENRVASRNYKHQGFTFGVFFIAEALKEVPTLCNPE